MDVVTSTAAGYQRAAYAWRARALRAESALQAQLEIAAVRTSTPAIAVCPEAPPAPAFADPFVLLSLGGAIVLGVLAGVGLSRL